MKTRYNKFNPKRKIISISSLDCSYLEWLCSNVRYGGNPQHKRSPGDFKLTPPSEPRAAKSLCDEALVFKIAEALHFMHLGIKKGFISERRSEKGFPQNIWSVKELPDGRKIPLEAQLENPQTGTYHGYPLQPSDPMYELILEKWR